MCAVLEVNTFTVLGVIVLTILEGAGTGSTSTVTVARTYDTIAGGVLPPSHMVVPSYTEK